MEEKIINNLGKLVDGNIWNIVCPKEEKPDTYIVFVIEEYGETYGDNTNSEYSNGIQINLFTKKNFTSLKQEIKKCLNDMEIIITSIIPLYEDETKFYHVVFEGEF